MSAPSERGAATAKGTITSDRAPKPLGPYSPALRCGNLIWISGQLGIDPQSGHLVQGGAAAEAEQALRNVEALLEAAGVGVERLVRVVIYLTDLAEFDAVNRVYQKCVQPPYPARVTVGVASLPTGARVEIEAVAAL